jgi:hypothetical protein
MAAMAAAGPAGLQAVAQQAQAAAGGAIAPADVQAALAQLAAAMGGGGAAAAPAAAAAAPAASVAPAPAWVTAALEWWTAAEAAAAAPVPREAVPALQAAAAEALGVPGELALVPGVAAEELILSPAAADAAAARAPAGGDAVLALQGAWARAAAAAASAPDARARPALALLARALAARAARVLTADDGEDLFFEGGRERSTLAANLASGVLAPAFADAMASTAASAADAALWDSVLRDAFAAFKDFSFARPESADGALRALDALTQGGALRRCLAAALLREAAAGGGAPRRGADFEAASIWAPLLSTSPYPRYDRRRGLLPLAFPAKEGLMQVRGYPRARGAAEAELGSVRRAAARLADAAAEIAARVARLKPPPGAAGGAAALRGREALPAWLAAAAAANEARADAGSYLDRVLSARPALFEASSDGFALGALAVALRACRPFLATPAKQEDALRHLAPAFYAAHAHRLPGAARERALGGAPRALEAGGRAPYPAVSPDRADGAAPHYIAEVFFATQRLVHVAYVPAAYRAQALAKLLARRRARGGGGGSDDSGSDDEGASPLDDGDDAGGGASLEEWLLADSARAALLDPALASDLVAFCELSARWVLRLLRAPPAEAAAAVALVPESAVRDLCAALQFLIRWRAADLLGGMDVGALVATLTGLLAAPALVPSPLVAYEAVQLLLAMLSPQLWQPRRGGAGALGRAHASPAERALVSAVLGTGAAQRELLPALMAAYVHADHVVGLDVDRDHYDKFAMRGAVDTLLMELWADPTCAASLSEAAAAADGSDLFPDFCGAVLNDLLYLLRDSLGRLEDIAALERSMADAAAWAAQPGAARREKEEFYASQQRAARGFMASSVTTLEMLNALVAARPVQAGFVGPRVVGRAAAAAHGFLELLVGPRGDALRAVRDPARYGFDPDALLLGVAQFALRLAEQPPFVAALAAAPDADAGVLRAAAAALGAAGAGEYEHRARLERLAADVEARRGGAAGAAAAAGAGDAPLDLSLPGAEDPGAGLEAAYAAALGPLAVGDFDASAPGAYSRAFAAMAAAPAADSPAKTRRVGREMRDLRSKMALPVHAAAACFVRHDAERLDKVRACVTGPAGTPYESGLFFFDAFFPAEYPAAPPLLELETTGGGVARFNPNLYADGEPSRKMHVDLGLLSASRHPTNTPTDPPNPAPKNCRQGLPLAARHLARRPRVGEVEPGGVDALPGAPLDPGHDLRRGPLLQRAGVRGHARDGRGRSGVAALQQRAAAQHAAPRDG